MKVLSEDRAPFEPAIPVFIFEQFYPPAALAHGIVGHFHDIDPAFPVKSQGNRIHHFGFCGHQLDPKALGELKSLE